MPECLYIPTNTIQAQTNVSPFHRGIQRRRKLTLPHKVTLSPHLCSFTSLIPFPFTEPYFFLFHISLTTFSFTYITNATHSSLTLTLFKLLLLSFLFLAIIFDTASRRPNGADSQQILGDGVGLSDPYHRHAHSLRWGRQGLLISPFFTSFIPAREGASTPLWIKLAHSCIHSKRNYSKTPNSAKVKQNGPLIWCTLLLNYTVI